MVCAAGAAAPNIAGTGCGENDMNPRLMTTAVAASTAGAVSDAVR